MLAVPDPEWKRYGRMAVHRYVDPDLVKRVYLELVRLEKQQKNHA